MPLLTRRRPAQRPVEQPWVTEAPAKLTFQTGDRVQVLRGAGILVLGGGEPPQADLAEVRELDDTGDQHSVHAGT